MRRASIGVVSCALACALALGVGALPARAGAPDTLLPELEQRLAGGSVDALNAYLNTHWAAAMTPLNQRTADCDLRAVSLAMRLGRGGSPARAVQAHGEALRAASGGCTRFVLALATPAEVSRYCRSQAAWGPAQTARELRRRIAAIDTDEQLRASRRGQACKAAYLYELNNTRVVVRRAAPASAP